MVLTTQPRGAAAWSQRQKQVMRVVSCPRGNAPKRSHAQLCLSSAHIAGEVPSPFWWRKTNLQAGSRRHPEVTVPVWQSGDSQKNSRNWEMRNTEAGNRRSQQSYLIAGLRSGTSVHRNQVYLEPCGQANPSVRVTHEIICQSGESGSDDLEEPWPLWASLSLLRYGLLAY